MENETMKKRGKLRSLMPLKAFFLLPERVQHFHFASSPANDPFRHVNVLGKRVPPRHWAKATVCLPGPSLSSLF
jgi:hypothetical protein